MKSLQFQKTTTTFLIECNKHVQKHVMSIFTPACFCCFLWSVETDGNPSSYQIESYSAAAVTSQSRINKAKTLANHPPVVWRKSFGVFGVWRLVSTKKHWQNIRSINNTHLDIWGYIFYFSSTSTLIWTLQKTGVSHWGANHLSSLFFLLKNGDTSMQIPLIWIWIKHPPEFPIISWSLWKVQDDAFE